MRKGPAALGLLGLLFGLTSLALHGSPAIGFEHAGTAGPSDAQHRATAGRSEPDTGPRSSRGPASSEPAEAIEVEQRLAHDPALRARTLAPLLDGLMTTDGAVREAAADRLTALSRARSLRLTRRGGPWTTADARSVLLLLLGDPDRFAADPDFRRRVVELLPRGLAPGTAPALRDRVLFHLNVEVGGLSFAESEALELAWSAVPRSSAAREAPMRPEELTFPDDLADPVRASIYSLPSNYIDAGDARRLLAAVHALAPDRTLVALTDLPMTRSLEPAANDLGLTLLETYGRAYSPWPRDPFNVVIRRDGGLALVDRPFRQRGREEDFFMAREVVQNLPEELDRRWGRPVWSTAPIQFHNGQILTADGDVWVSLHSLEQQILRDLTLDHVPAETFGDAAGIDRYLAAARRAMDEMASFYGKPVRLVHGLPTSGQIAARSASMARIGGGAGYDLDSLVTLLPGKDGRLRALVGDVDGGRRLLRSLDAEDRRALRETYHLLPEDTELTSRLLDYQEGARATGLEGFLDLIAEHLESTGLTVGRLPLLLVPVALLDGGGALDYPDFVLGWNNVVLDVRDGAPRAEGFASRIPSGDRLARERYDAMGTRLDLLPPLVGSVIHNGGYRCASNQVREPGAGTRRSNRPRGAHGGS